MQLKRGYLAHPFDTRNAIKIWQKKFEMATGLELINPFYDLERTDVIEIDEDRAGRYEKLDPTELVERDLAAIFRSDFVVAFVTGALSYGTIQEIVYAKLGEKPVFLIVTNGHEGHPWLVYHATKVFTCAGDFIDFMLEFTTSDNEEQHDLLG
jgi:nucleoside 2-deoxyribosyltransferase